MDGNGWGGGRMGGMNRRLTCVPRKRYRLSKRVDTGTGQVMEGGTHRNHDTLSTPSIWAAERSSHRRT